MVTILANAGSIVAFFVVLQHFKINISIVLSYSFVGYELRFTVSKRVSESVRLDIDDAYKYIS